MSTHSQFPANPASISPMLDALYPAGVVGVELRGPGEPAMLYPEESELLERAASKRIQEFSAGRLCARLALEALGIVNFPLRAATDRQPLWPDSIVGSISHTRGLCVAVAAPKSRLAAIGIDCEVLGDLTEELWPAICTAEESAWVHSFFDAERAAAAAFIFSAKESFYKLQYPLTEQWLDFHDLSLEVFRSDRFAGEFRVHPTRPIKLGDLKARAFTGRYVFTDGFVITGTAIATADR